jgi:hypothetical protein
MTTEPTQHGVVERTAGDADDVADHDAIDIDLPCRCGYDLRDLPLGGHCPECGASIGALLDDLEQASLDGRAKRRFGASLLIGNHVAWIGLMSAWVLNVREEMRYALPLFAAAGPRAITSIEVFRPGVVRAFAGAAACLLALHMIGLWLLIAVVKDERQPKARRLGAALFLAQAIAAVIGIVLFATQLPRQRVLIDLSLLDLPVAILLGLYVRQLGLIEGSPLLRMGGGLLAHLLALSNITMIAWAWLTLAVGTSIHPTIYIALATAGLGGTLLLAILFRLRTLLSSERPG